MSGRKGMKDYPNSIKLEAVRMYLEQGRTHREIMEVLSIHDKNRIRIWTKQYRELGAEYFSPSRRISIHSKLGRPSKTESVESKIARLEMENALLKKMQAELREVPLAQRNIGRSTTTEEPIQ